MIKVLFFASYRERLNCDQLELSDEQCPETLSALRERLSTRGEGWREVLNDSRTLVAHNQTMVRRDVSLQKGDEVAFFPPVTGG